MPFIKRIPECPRCKSLQTGLIRYDSDRTYQKLAERALKKGHYLKISAPGFLGSSYDNLFCNNCGMTWRGDYDFDFLDNDEYREYLSERNIDVKNLRVKKNRLEQFALLVVKKIKTIIPHF